MKDNRFIELVNLYIDRQIGPAEAAELESEIQTNPRRRQVYLQYCRMHRATKLVYESFRTDSNQPGTAAQPGSIARFEHSRQRARRNRWLYTASGFAAAACVTLALVRFNSVRLGQAPAGELATKQSNATQTVVAAATPVSEPAPVTANTVPLRTPTAAEQAYTAALFAHQREQAAFASQPVTFPAASLFDDGVFETKSSLTAEQQRRLFQPKVRAESQGQAEFTAFQFQR